MCSRDTAASSITADSWAVITNCVDANSSWQMGNKTSQLSSPWKCICTAFPLARGAWYSQACWAVAPVPPDVTALPVWLAEQVACKRAFIQKPWMLYWQLDVCRAIPCSHLDPLCCLPELHWKLNWLLQTHGILHSPSKRAQSTCLSTCVWAHPATASASHWHITDR